MLLLTAYIIISFGTISSSMLFDKGVNPDSAMRLKRGITSHKAVPTVAGLLTTNSTQGHGGKPGAKTATRVAAKKRKNVRASIAKPRNTARMYGEFVSITKLEGSYVRPYHMDWRKIDQILTLHNNLRSSVAPAADQMLKMSWDYELEARSWIHSNGCQFLPSSHEDRATDSFAKVGENMWMGWGVPIESFNPVNVISTWRKEKENFDASLRSCIGDSCEFYVQMIWLTSYKLGCAWSRCDDMNVFGYAIREATFLVCHYGPGMDDVPFVPYYHGLSCSFCDPADTCEQNLCTNYDRDQPTGTSPVQGVPTVGPDSQLSTRPMSEEAKTALIVIGSLLGCTLLIPGVMYIGVRFARRRAEGQLLDYFMNIPRRLTLWYENRRNTQQDFNNAEMGGNAETNPVKDRLNGSIDYQLNFWSD